MAEQPSGTDHSAHFPDKQTGLYSKLDPKVGAERLLSRAHGIQVIYFVYGHPWDEREVWRPRVPMELGMRLEVPTDGPLKQGYLLKVQQETVLSRGR